MFQRQPHDSYVEHMEKIYRSRPYVGAKDRKTLYDLSKRLARQGIDYDTFFERMSKGLIWFVDQKKWKYVPVNVISGQWALKYYKENFSRIVVMKYTVDMQRVTLIYTELMIANALLSGIGKTYDETVQKLQPLLPPNWLDVRRKFPKDMMEEVVSNLRCRYNDLSLYTN